MSENNFTNQLLSVDDLSKSEVEEIFDRASEFKIKGFSSSRILKNGSENAPVVALAFLNPQRAQNFLSIAQHNV